ncbi:hypothetical protein Tco_0087684 [Tanacetum coccineum]
MPLTYQVINLLINFIDVIMKPIQLVKEKVMEQVKKEVHAQVRDQVPVYLTEGLILERKTTKEEMKRLISKAILQERGRMQAQISSQIQNAIDNAIPSLVDASADPLLQQQDIAIWLALQMKFEKTQVPQTACRSSTVRTRDHDDPHDDTHPEGENSNQEQDDEFDFWTDSYASDDDEIPTKQVTQDIMEEIYLTIDEAKLKKMAEEMLRQRCTSGDEHQYHIDQMKNFLQSDISIVARRANDCIVSITESDYKNLNKNDIEDMYLLSFEYKVPDMQIQGIAMSLSVFIRSSVTWERVHDFQLGIESYQQKINLTAPTITFPGIEEYNVFSIVYEPVHGIIYTNSKKEKRVMRHSEIHKFCDATLRRMLEGLKSYYNDVKYGYVKKELTNDEVEFLKLFEEDIEVRLNYRDQMRR